MIDMDRTFCLGHKCEMRTKCDRWRYSRLVEDALIKYRKLKTVSTVDTFMKADGTCDMFSEFDEDEKRKAQGEFPEPSDVVVE